MKTRAGNLGLRRLLFNGKQSLALSLLGRFKDPLKISGVFYHLSRIFNNTVQELVGYPYRRLAVTSARAKRLK